MSSCVDGNVIYLSDRPLTPRLFQGEIQCISALLQKSTDVTSSERLNVKQH